MALGKRFRVMERNVPGVPYSVLLEKRFKNECILLESKAIFLLSSTEREYMKRKYTHQLCDAYGCLGILPAFLTHYLVMVTGVVSVGEIEDGIIYRITQTQFIPLRGPPGPDDEKVADLKKLLNSGFFYFSWSPNKPYAMDITMCAQRRSKTAEPDNRYFWNRTLHIPFLRAGIKHRYDWLLVVICGSVEIRTIFSGPKRARAVIFARISNERAGTRFNMRGVNDDGFVANFVETEQAIFCEKEESSFVQIRGSVPIFWEQPGIQVGSHKVRISREFQATVPAFQKHVVDLKEKYGHQIFVNLLSTFLIGIKDGEAALSQAFEAHHKFLPECEDVTFVAFDYHQECRAGILKNLHKIKNKLETLLEAHGVFCSKLELLSGGEEEEATTIKEQIIQAQQGTIRTNCLDCLDRTNSVQTFFGLEMLNKQLELLDLLQNKAHTASRFKEVFQQLWTNTGNELSRFSTGSGISSGGSMLMDVSRSAARTLQNNLLDTNKQDAIDLLLGIANNELADKARCLLPPCVLNAPENILREMVLRSPLYLMPVNLRIAVGTYNVNGGKHFRSIVYKSLSLADWLLDCYGEPNAQAPEEASSHVHVDDCGACGLEKMDQSVQLFAIGVQEIVDLNASQIMSASSKNAKHWADELEKVISRDEEFVMLTYVQLVGVCLFIFVKPHLVTNIREVAVDTVKTGFGGATGNKGAVAVRFLLYNTSVAFVCAHFAAGQSQVAERNADYSEITRRISFSGRTLNSHDYVFWCGDFNYRVDMNREEIKQCLNSSQRAKVLSKDQLKKEQTAGRVFKNFMEGPIDFDPTYKYDLFSDDYDTSEKQRAPAWTDRVLWRRKKQSYEHDYMFNPGRSIFYGRAELKQSDHRPVISVIEIDAFKIDKSKRSDVFAEVINDVGPPDATLVVQVEQNDDDFDTDSFVSALLKELSVFGEVLFVRYLEDKVLLTFRDSQAALTASERGEAQVCGIKANFSLYTSEWAHLYDKEIKLCNSRTAPMNDYLKPLVIPDEVKESEAVAGALEPEQVQSRELPEVAYGQFYLDPIQVREFENTDDQTLNVDDVYEVIPEEEVVGAVFPALPPPPPPPRIAMVPPPVPPRAGIPPPIPPRRDL